MADSNLGYDAIRGLKTIRTASVSLRRHAFIQNLRRGRCGLGSMPADVIYRWLQH